MNREPCTEYIIECLDRECKIEELYEKDNRGDTPLHAAACNEIVVDSWRDECLNLDWSDAAIEHKLADLGYRPVVLIEGTDARGIDVALLSKLPLLGEPLLQPLILPDFPDRQGDTRGVLQATFVLPDNSRLTAFSVHFPAPLSPDRNANRSI